MTIVINQIETPVGFQLIPLNTIRSSQIIYAYTAAHEKKIARDVYSLWTKQANEIITRDLAETILTTRQLSIDATIQLKESITKWIVTKLAPQWESVMAVGATGMIKSIERYIGRDLGTTPKANNLFQQIYNLSEKVSVTKKSVFVPKELKDLIDSYYAGTWNPGFYTDFPEVASSMTSWIKTRGASEAIRYNEAQLQTWQRVIHRGVVEQGINGTDLAKQLEHSTGLTVKMEATVERHRAALIAEGSSKTVANKSAAKYARTLRKRRALSIGRTELANAYNGSRHLTIEDSINKGVIKETVVKKWYTADDERVCPVCSPLHDTVVGFKEKWISVSETTGKETQSGEHPPIHTLCRCIVIYEMLKRQSVTFAAA